jgi:serine/threonine protein kinase
MSLSAGDKLGPYEIIAPIGAGGMGEVYKARDARLGRDVAVKVLPEHLSKDPQALARFLREYRALAALSHPNILAIFDTGTEKGASYAVTELLEGETLRSILARGALAWRKALDIGTALAEGLAAAHSKNITHRDLKPANIFLTSDGRTKILDFGLARLEQPVGEDAETRTETGTVVGTPGYMSPEQVLGQPAGPTSDIFSLGCVFFEMVSGQRAFPGHTLAETMSSILRDTPPDLAAVRAPVPRELDRLIAHCLDKNPQERCQSARDLAFHLKAIVSSGAGATLVLRRQRPLTRLRCCRLLMPEEIPTQNICATASPRVSSIASRGSGSSESPHAAPCSDTKLGIPTRWPWGGNWTCAWCSRGEWSNGAKRW